MVDGKFMSTLDAVALFGAKAQVETFAIEPSAGSHAINSGHVLPVPDPRDAEIAQFLAEIARLQTGWSLEIERAERAETELAAARKDTKRLDWLGRNTWTQTLPWMARRFGDHDDLRSAIDAAIGREAPAAPTP